MSLKETIILSLLTLALGLLCEARLMDPWVALIVLAIAAALLLWHAQDRLKEKARSKEQSLQTQVKISAKDASLKQQQIMTILANIPSPLAMMDSYGHLILYNEGFGRFLNEDTDEGMNYRDERIDSEIRLFLKEAYLSESAIMRNLHFNGIDFQCLSVPVQEKSRFTGCLLVFQDITQAMEKERMQKRFIADASHELKTPISAIKGMIEILNRDDFNDPETMKEFHIQIEKENERLEQIVSDLLQLSRLSLSQTMLKRSVCSLDELFDSLIREARQEARSRGITLEVHCQTARPYYLDEQKLHQALANLIRNALLHSGGTHILLEAAEEGGSLILKVKDDGCGIDQKNLDRIFERFYRIDTHRSRLSGGSGLGLAIVKAIVNAHGGDIEVSSLPTKGTQFRIRLPILIENDSE